MESGNKELSSLWGVDAEMATEICKDALKAADGDVLKAANALGVTKRTLYRWMQERPGIKK